MTNEEAFMFFVSVLIALVAASGGFVLYRARQPEKPYHYEGYGEQPVVSEDRTKEVIR